MIIIFLVDIYWLKIMISIHLTLRVSLNLMQQAVAGSRHDMPPGLRATTAHDIRHCAHMYRSPLLYVHVGLPVQPLKAAL